MPQLDERGDDQGRAPGLQVRVPGERHEDVRGDQQQDRPRNDAHSLLPHAMTPTHSPSTPDRIGAIMFGTQHLRTVRRQRPAARPHSRPGHAVHRRPQPLAGAARRGCCRCSGSFRRTVHTLAAAFGLSAILATSAQAFLVVKLAGAAYLVYLGVRMLLERPCADSRHVRREPGWAIYRAGLLTNVLNPKVALFFMAFLPQFVARGAVAGARLPVPRRGVHLQRDVVVPGPGVVRLGDQPAAGGHAHQRRHVEARDGCLFVGLGVRLAVSK